MGKPLVFTDGATSQILKSTILKCVIGDLIGQNSHQPNQMWNYAYMLAERE